MLERILGHIFLPRRLECGRRAFAEENGDAIKSKFRSSRDVIIRTDDWAKAVKFYGKVLGLPVTHRSKTLAGFETGAFCLYVEKGKRHGPTFEFLVPDIEAAKRKLLDAGCTVLEEDATVPRCYLRDPYGLEFNLGQDQTKQAARRRSRD